MRTADGPQRGKRGKLVASRNRFGQYHRERGPHKNHRTPAQKRVRGNLSEFARLWNHLTEERRVAWRARAREVRSRRSLGQSGPLDGPLLFKKLNTVLATCGRGPLLDPPPRPEFGPNPVIGFAITDGADGLAFELSVRKALVGDIMVYAWAPSNPGVEKNSNYAYLGLLPAPEDGQSDITDLYLGKLKEWRKLKDKRYHVPLEGSKVFIRVWQQANGWENELGMFRASAFVPIKGAAAGHSAGGKPR
jgi:hypothetical protein